MNGTTAAQYNAEHEPNPYREKVLSVRTLYDVGERYLNDSDIVEINGIPCYVLEVDGSKAKMITVNIYNANFDNGGHTAEEVDNCIGKGFNNRTNTFTYNYNFSTLKTWMADFYVNELNSDSKILPVTINYYTKNDSNESFNDGSSYTSNSLSNQFVFALDGLEAINKNTKFGWNEYSKFRNYFWTTAGYLDNSGNAYVVTGTNDANISAIFADRNNYAGARPVFWITLE